MSVQLSRLHCTGGVDSSRDIGYASVMATAKKPKPSKSAFVRSLPSTLSALEVSEQAKAAGIKVSAAYVYSIRAAAKARTRGLVRPADHVVPHGAEDLLRAIGAELGLGHAIELLKAERAKVSRLL